MRKTLDIPVEEKSTKYLANLRNCQSHQKQGSEKTVSQEGPTDMTTNVLWDPGTEIGQAKPGI